MISDNYHTFPDRTPSRDRVRQAHYPLSPLQAGMLFHQMKGERGVDVEQLVCRTREAIEFEPFADALALLVRRHPMLRTRFGWEDGGEPWQEIVDTVVVPVDLDDRRATTSLDRPSDFLALLHRDRIAGFTLSRAPLIRARIVLYGDTDTRILLTIHHAIVDGRSFPILLMDLFALYEAQITGADPPAQPELPRMEFREYVQWSRDREGHDSSQRFWVDVLKGFTAPTPLAVDGLPDCHAEEISWQEEISLDAVDTRALEALANQHSVTMNTVVQAAWAMLLSKYSGEIDVVFGGTRACRKSSLPGVEDAVGLFVNTLPVRAHLGEDVRLQDLFQELRGAWVAMRDHEHTPLTQIQTWSDLENGQPLFHSIVVFERFDLGEEMRKRGGAWAEREVEVFEKTNFPITLAAYHGHALRLKIEFDTTRFSRATILRMLGHLRHLLIQCIEKPAATVGEFELVTGRELRELHSVWASPKTFSVEETLVDWFESQVQRTPKHTALSSDGREWTYRELNRAVNQVAHQLIHAYDMGPGHIVGLCVERSPEIVIGILAILKSGAAYLPIDLAYPAERLQWMIEDSGAPLLLCQERLMGQLPPIKPPVVTFEAIQQTADSSPDEDPDVSRNVDDLAYVIFTSGSTGKPKGCKVTHRNVARLMRATEDWYRFDKNDVWTLFHSHAFDFSVWEIWGALLYGGRLVVVPFDTTRSPEDFYKLLRDENVTVLNQTPSAFRQLIEVDRRLSESPNDLTLRYVIFGGEALEPESLRPWFERHGDAEPRLVNMYGITETTVHVTYRPLSQDDLTAGSVIGRAIPDLEIHVLDPRGKPLPLGVPGEIYVGGAGVSDGYLNRPEQTAARFIELPDTSEEILYRTGDVGRFLPGNDLEYLGRCDDQVKIRGFRIELGEIQTVLTRHPEVREAFVTVTGQGDEKRIVAYLVAEKGPIEISALRAHAGAAMPPYMIPAAMVFLDRLPLTNNGKIDRKALATVAEERDWQRSKPFTAPRGDTETALAQIWAAVLKVNGIARDDNYFELGGDSILSIQIVSRARSVGLNLTPRDLFDHQTIAELANAAAHRMETKPVIGRAIPAGPAPLTPIQRWFFAHEHENPNHWNQAFLFDLKRELDPQRLSEALGSLIDHHPALKTRFTEAEQAETEANFYFRFHQSPIHGKARLALCQQAQRSLDITNGRLLGVVYFSGGTDRAPQLFIAVHHLGIDGVSWRILLEDLEALYTGTSVQPSTTPFIHWAHHLNNAITAEKALQQKSFWLGQNTGFELPMKGNEPNIVANSESLVVSLSEAETDRLLRQVPRATRSHLDEVFVTVLGSALAKWSGKNEVTLDLEGHGRAEEHGHDLSRTIGWFTTIYPARLSIEVEASLERRLADVKRTLRALPEKGFRYPLLDLPAGEKRDVLFNYLGQIDQMTNGSALFRLSEDASGCCYDPQSQRSHRLEINAWVRRGCLEFNWSFVGLDRNAAELAANDCLEALRDLVTLTSRPRPAAWIAADFPLVNLRDRDLAHLPGSIEDILALTPIQHLYYTLETARAGSGIDRWHWKLEGELDPHALREAWQSAIDLHPVLRTEFKGDSLLEPVQVVRPTCELDFEIIQSKTDQSFESILQADLAKGLPVDRAPLMRLTLVRLSDRQHRLIWTHHHLQIDGWSWPILLSHVTRAYRSLIGNETIEVAPAASIRDYVSWLQKKDLTSSEAFWAAHLEGFTTPTPIISDPNNRAAPTFADVHDVVDGDCLHRLRGCARKLACPLNTLMQAAWAVLLCKRSGQEDLVFGASFSGRPADLPGVESIVGAFVNNLPVRARINGDESFSELAGQLQAQVADLSEHQFLPLTEIQQCSEIPLRFRLFDSLIVFQNYAGDESSSSWGPSLRLREFTAPVRTNFPLTLVIDPKTDLLNLNLVYQNGHFSDAEAKALLTEFTGLLQRVACSPHETTGDLCAGVDLPQVSFRTPIDRLDAPSANPPVTALQHRIAAVWQNAFGMSRIGIDDNFFDLGGHSLLLVQVHALLRRELDSELSVVDVLGNPTIRSLATAVEGRAGRISEEPKVPRHHRQATRDIAIIGMSGRFPGAESVDEFWQNLVDNIESIEEHDDDELRRQGLDPDAMRTAGEYVQRRGQIPDPDCFDAAFFGMTPNEAAAMDPQQRLFLETAWAALEDAGHAPSRNTGSIGVFAGMSNNTFYEQYVSPDTKLCGQLGDLMVMMGNEKDYLATRTAYKLNLTGPALNIHTACSTSLVAVAEAVHALREGRCDMAIAGAISLTFPQSRGYYYEEGGITSPDGHCRPFDASAAGTVFGNGMAAVILKPLDLALADRDCIRAVVRGVGLNNDGADKVSFTAPSVAGQAAAIRKAQQEAGIEPESIQFIEAHGTGTALGDPIEVEALSRAFRQGTDQRQFCALGSVKSNIGHLDAAAGMAGLIKACLALERGIIPATLHLDRPNPKLRIETTPFTLTKTNQVWERPAANPRRAGVSSFGVGGTNAHLVLEEAPPLTKPSNTQLPERDTLVLLSAKTSEALWQKRQQLADHLERHPEIDFADLAYTLAVGREVFHYRLALVAKSAAGAVAQLRDSSLTPIECGCQDLPVAFLFPGQGSQFSGMGQALYREETVYREAVDACADFLHSLIGADIRQVMFDASEESQARLQKTRFTQPALFVTSYALTKLWQSKGVNPTSMIGHSVGEYAAACASGVMDRDDALTLIAKRAALVDDLPGGAMLSIRLPEDEVLPLLGDDVEIAALNSGKMTVVAGAEDAIDGLETDLRQREIAHKRLRTSHAFHSAMMEAVVAPFRNVVASVPRRSPSIPYISNVSGHWISAEEVADPGYWAGHVRQTVRFADGVRTLLEEGSRVLVEAGPGRSCVTFAKQSVPSDTNSAPITSLLNQESDASFLTALGKLWAAGGRIDWQTYFSGEARRRIPLPTYPFQRQRHWPEAFTPKLPLQAREFGTPSSTPTPSPTVSAPDAGEAVKNREDRLKSEATLKIAELVGLDPATVDPAADFLALGFDSLLIGQAAVTLSRHFGTWISFRQLMDEFESIDALVRHLDEVLPEEAFAIRPVQVSSSADDSEDRERYSAGALHRETKPPVSFGPFRPVEESPDQDFTPRQQQHLDHLIETYTSFTLASKNHVQQHRSQLADPRAAAGFHRAWKEMVYPIVTKRSQGAYLWDLDGNRWIDVTHGFGLGLLGHRPQCVVDAISDQLSKGFEIGPSSPLAGEVAAMICEVSGKDRTTFCNTGSEAVMAAIRVARTVNQRDKIAVFQGSYHGIFDEVLGRPLVRNGELVSVPIALGIPGKPLENVLILDYGNPESLAFIEQHADDLAAVLVEPVQSRRPDLQPREFLVELRQLTSERNIALIFDEVVTGFRSHPNGAQGVFGIDADLVTYGKVLGGGMPIGAVAGNRHYMDALDGGHWQFGDESGPESSVTFFAGTFVRHPLALAAAKAVLSELGSGGGRLQEELDARTALMVERMNAFCAEHGIPLKVTRFSSIYFFNFAKELKYASLFFYHMRRQGIHIWESRPSFLSLAHTPEDIEAIYSAFCQSLHALQEGGFLPEGESDDEDGFPLTSEQEEVFLASMMSPEGSLAFNESISLIFDGQLDRGALQAALSKLNQRHECLRTTFRADAAAQRVSTVDEQPLVLTEYDLREHPDEAKRLRKELLTRSFDLIHGPTSRAYLLRLADESHEMILSCHHTVCDGWSFGVLYEDLVRLYQLETGQGGALDDPATPYRRFVEQQASPSVRRECEQATDYWISQLTPPPPALRLPLDDESIVESRSSDTIRRCLPAELCERIHSFCQNGKITPSVLLFAAYRDVLARISQQDDFCIGTPLAAQASSGFSGLCGHGVHFLPLRCRLKPEITLEEYLTEIRRLILDSIDQQQSTLSRIVRQHPDRQQLPPITTTFTLESFPPDHELDDLNVRVQINPKYHSNFDLSLFVADWGERIALTAHYREGKFARERIDRWLDLMIDWLDAAVRASANEKLHHLALYRPDAQPSIVAESPKRPSRSIVDTFEQQVESTPDRTGIRCGEEQLSYRQINGLANALAHEMAAMDVRPGDRVLLSVDRSVEFIVAVLGILKCGAAYVPIDPNYPAERRALLRQTVAPKLEIDEARLAELFAELKSEDPLPNPPLACDAESLAYVMFTSGSSGTPKGVMIPHRGVTRLVDEPNYMEMHQDDVFLLSAPLSFDASTLEIWAPLLNGGCLAIPQAGPLTVADLAANIRLHGVTVLWLTSGLFQLMIDEAPESLKGLRTLLTGGDVVSRAHIAKAMRLLPHTCLINGYGPTENTTFTTCHRITEEDLRRPSIPIGKPIRGTTVYLLNDRLEPVPPGTEGELYAAGQGVALGYLNQPERSARHFVHDPFVNGNGAKLYRTGDRCRLLPSGALEFLGRIDHQIKIRGYRIEPHEIEAAIEKHPSIAQCRIATEGEGAEAKSLVACCIGDATQREALCQSLRGTLPDYLRPSKFAYVDRFPLDPNGKIKLSAIEDRNAPASHGTVSTVAPVTPTETRLFEIWSDLLGTEAFGIHHSFFDLGGHSLLGLRLFTRLHKEFGFTKPLAILFDHRTIASLATLIDNDCKPREIEALGPKFDEHIAKLKSDGEETPLFLIHGGDGGVIFYHPLVDYLRELDCPIYAIESPTLTGEDSETPEFSAIPRDYLRMIRAAQPEGPYRIGGYSFGGLVAYEIAKMLAEEDEDVKLVLFDTANPKAVESGRQSLRGRVETILDQHANERFTSRWSSVAKRFFGGLQSKSKHHLRLLRAERRQKSRQIQSLEELPLIINERYHRSLNGYVPSGVIDSAILIRSSVTGDAVVLPSDYGWGEHITKLEIIEVPGGHFDVFDSPSLSAMRDSLVGYLEADP